MASSHAQSFTAALRAILARPDLWEVLEPVLTEQKLADPDRSINAAMDDRIPRDARPEILRQTQRCLLAYIGWLLDDAPARHPSWAKDELQRALRRLVEVQTAAKTARPKLH